MNEISFEEAVARLIERGSPYPSEAYYLVREALDHSVAAREDWEETGEATPANEVAVENPAERSESEPNRHVTGQALCLGFREVVLRQFGPLASTVLAEWNLQETRDVGIIVYQLIETGAFGRQEEDRIDDFYDVYDFEKAFVLPYLPPSERSRPSAKPSRKGSDSYGS